MLSGTAGALSGTAGYGRIAVPVGDRQRDAITERAI
jgi:hypothetical protein